MTEYKKIHIGSEHVSKRQSKQIIVEMNYIMPDNKPRINSVVDTFIKPSLSAMALDGDYLNFNLSTECTLVYNALSVSEEEEHVFSTACTFSKMFKETLDIESNGESLSESRAFTLDVHTDNVETMLISDRKAVVKAYVTLTLLLKETFGIDAVETFTSENIITKKKSIDSMRSLGIVRTQSLIKEDVQIDAALPQADTVIAKKATVTIDNKKITDGKAVFYGTAHVDVVCSNLDSDRHFYNSGFDINFNQMCELPDITENAVVNIKPDISELTFDIKENNVLGIEGLVTFEVETFDYFRYDVIDDAFMTNATLLLDKKTENGSDSFTVSNPTGTCSEKQNADASEVLLSDVCAKECNSFIDGKNIRFEGIYSIKTLYVPKSDTNTVKTVISEIPFNYQFEAKCTGGDVADYGIDVKNATAQLNDYGEITVKWNATANAVVTEQNGFDLITGAEERENTEPKERALYYHFMGENEKIWDAAKQFGIAPEEITKINGIKEEDILKTQKGVIIVVK